MFQDLRIAIRGLLRRSLASTVIVGSLGLAIGGNLLFRPLPGVVITEFLASNQNGMADEDTSTEDWIEICNRGSNAVDLAGWSLSDDEGDPGKWVFPSVTLDPDAYLVLFASGKDRKFPSGGHKMHVNFKLNRSGEHLGLYTPDSPRVLAGGVTGTYPEQRNDHSFGLDPADQWRYFVASTPGSVNGTSDIRGVVEPVVFSVTRGHYDEPFTLTLTTSTKAAEIRYTTDGSAPTPATGVLYGAPLNISSTTFLRAAAFRNNHLPSRVTTHTYFFGLTAAQQALPVMSIVINANDLRGPTGIIGMQGGSRNRSDAWILVGPSDYFNPTMRGGEWEKPASVEYIKPENHGGFQIDAGIRVQGSDFARPRFHPENDANLRRKISYRLYFRGDYGSSKLKYPLFEDSPVDEFDHVVLRAGMNDRVDPFIRDELVRQLHTDMGQVAAHGNFVNLFINGEYKGYYNPTERVRSTFMQSHHGGSEDWDVLAADSAAQEGDNIAWNALRSQVEGEDVTDPTVYQQIEQKLDLVNFVDYLLVNVYSGMGDWPHSNWRAGRDRGPEGIYRFYVWDAEWGFGGFGVSGRRVSFNSFTGTSSRPNSSGLANTAEISRLYQRLKQSAEFRLLFADRINEHFFNEGALTDAHIIQRFDEMNAELSGVFNMNQLPPPEGAV